MIVESTSRLATCETDGFCLQGFKMWMTGSQEIQSTQNHMQLLGLIYLLPYKKCQKETPMFPPFISLHTS